MKAIVVDHMVKVGELSGGVLTPDGRLTVNMMADMSQMLPWESPAAGVPVRVGNVPWVEVTPAALTCPAPAPPSMFFPGVQSGPGWSVDMMVDTGAPDLPLDGYGAVVRAGDTVVVPVVTGRRTVTPQRPDVTVDYDRYGDGDFVPRFPGDDGWGGDPYAPYTETSYGIGVGTVRSLGVEDPFFWSDMLVELSWCSDRSVRPGTTVNTAPHFTVVVSDWSVPGQVTGCW